MLGKMELIPSKARCAELKTSFSAIWLSRWSSSTSRCSARTSLCSLCSTLAPPFLFLLLLLLASTCSEATVLVDGRRSQSGGEMVALGGGFDMLQEASPWGKMVENMMAGSQISLHKHQWKIILAEVNWMTQNNCASLPWMPTHHLSTPLSMASP